MFVRGQGSELYRHEGSSSEQLNLVDDPRYAAVVRSLSQRLRAGPTTGGGWGLARIKSDDVGGPPTRSASSCPGSRAATPPRIYGGEAARKLN